MRNLRLASIEVELETIKQRLNQISERNERAIMLREMRELIEKADEILKGYIEEIKSK